MDSIIDKTIIFVKQQLKNAEGGHDWFHIERVYKNYSFVNYVIHSCFY